MSDVRLDVWLWAARFYKTRTLCKEAIDAGQVRVNGEPVKPAKSVSIGMRVRIKQGSTLREVAVLALSDVRRGAPEAQQLYAETPESLAKREQEQLARKAADGMVGDGKPSKKFRRAVIQFKQSLGYDD
ncbi:MAG: S4 domain-containing protein [Stagnimonas sp.]|nr:S4 domain-containing protein [Stagnimonas sp.]